MPGPVIPNPTPDWLKPENASVTDTALTKAMRMIGHLIGADNPTAQVLGLMMTDVPGGAATGGLAKAVEGLKARVIKAYHGSPHDFERFSLEKIGTGEGAQAYGHGLYFAESPETASYYKNSLVEAQRAREPIHYRGKEFPPGTGPHRVLADIADKGKDETIKALEKDIAFNRDYAPTQAALKEHYLDFARSIDPAEVKVTQGKTYEVAIHADPEDFLDWDKPLSQQSEKVKQALGPMGGSPDDIRAAIKVFEDAADRSTSERFISSMYAQADKLKRQLAVSEQAKGSEFYHHIADTGGGMAHKVTQWSGSPGASEKLKELGIPGIKYLDQGSRAAGEGSRNYVVFDDRLIDILKKYGLLLPAAGAATQGQTLISPRGEQ